MYQILFLLLALAVLCTVFRLLWITFPRLKTKSGKILIAGSLAALFLPLLIPVLLSAHPAYIFSREDLLRITAYIFSVICVVGVTAAALVDGREGTTAFELYPVAIGLTAPIVIVTDFISTESILYNGISSPVIGLLIGLGAAALAGIIEMAVLPTESLVLGTIEMASVCGFFAGFPGVVWVLGLSIPLCLAARLYGNRHPKQRL